MISLPHIAGRVFDTPLLIARAKLDTIMGVLMPRFRGEALPAAQPSASSEYDVTPEGIAIIPVFGTLVRRTVGLEAQSGFTSYATISQQLGDALADQTVKAILLDIDSPGGEAGGVFDLADQIYAARTSQSRLRGAQSSRDQESKPIWAVADEEAFSAAYAIAAAASKIYVSRTGGVGSIGVIAVHLDQSQAEADAGLQYTAIYAGARKNDLSPHEPLSDPARATLQTEVDRVYELFVSTVARMRGLDPDAVKATEAGLYFGEDALTAGLADQMGTYGDALGDLTARITPKPPRLSLPLLNTNPRKDKPMNQLHDPNTGTAAETTAALPVAASPPIDLDAVRAQARAEAKAEALAYVAEVNELCQLAAMPDKASAFIAKAVPVAEIRKTLLSAQASASEATAIIGQLPANANAASTEQKIDTAAIYAARNAATYPKKGN